MSCCAAKKMTTCKRASDEQALHERPTPTTTEAREAREEGEISDVPTSKARYTVRACVLRADSSSHAVDEAGRGRGHRRHKNRLVGAPHLQELEGSRDDATAALLCARTHRTAITR